MEFCEIEQEIVKNLIEDVRRVKPQDRTALKERIGKKVLRLMDLMQEQYKTRCSVEYLFYLVRFYTSESYRTAQSQINSFLRAINIRYRDLSTQHLYKAYRKLIKHKISDMKIQGTEQDNEIYACEGVSFVKSLGSKALHFF